jgi:hypothetical protein
MSTFGLCAISGIFKYLAMDEETCCLKPESLGVNTRVNYSTNDMHGFEDNDFVTTHPEPSELTRSTEVEDIG